MTEGLQTGPEAAPRSVKIAEGRYISVAQGFDRSSVEYDSATRLLKLTDTFGAGRGKTVQYYRIDEDSNNQPLFELVQTATLPDSPLPAYRDNVVWARLHREDAPAAFNDESSAYRWNGLLHRFDGPAVTFPSMRHELYYLFDHPVSKEKVEDLSLLTIDDVAQMIGRDSRAIPILAERMRENAQKRDAEKGGQSVTPDFFGVVKAWSMSPPADEKLYGKLWRFVLPDGEEPGQVVEVVNGTPELDGTFKHYYLRVPFRMSPQTLQAVRPNEPGVEIKTAKAAVAWTYGMREDQYNPEVRT